MLSMIPIGINIEDIQYVGSSVVGWGVDLAICFTKHRGQSEVQLSAAAIQLVELICQSQSKPASYIDSFSLKTTQVSNSDLASESDPCFVFSKYEGAIADRLISFLRIECVSPSED